MEMKVTENFQGSLYMFKYIIKGLQEAMKKIHYYCTVIPAFFGANNSFYVKT